MTKWFDLCLLAYNSILEREFLAKLGRAMYELEIMVTGYTIMVSAVTAGIIKCINNKKFNKLYDEIYELEKKSYFT